MTADVRTSTIGANNYAIIVSAYTLSSRGELSVLQDIFGILLGTFHDGDAHITSSGSLEATKALYFNTVLF